MVDFSSVKNFSRNFLSPPKNNMSHKLKILSLNVRGLRNTNKRRAILSYLKKTKKPQFLICKRFFQGLKTRRFGQQNGEEKFFLPWHGAFERTHNAA